ncbi:MAG: sensor histidine kinase [Frankia sp.]
MTRRRAPATIRRALRWRGWPLRTRLVAALLGLTAAVCIVIGVVTGVGLRHYLVDRLDGQVADADRRFAATLHPPFAGRDPSDPANAISGSAPATSGSRAAARFLTGPGAQVGTVGAHILAGQVTSAGILDRSATLRTLSAQDQAGLLSVPADGHAHTRTIAGHGSYRVVAMSQGDGSVLVAGLPLNAVNATIRSLVITESAVIAAGLFAAGLVGTTIVRVTLRPLGRVAAAAVRVTHLPLDRGTGALPSDLPALDTDPRTEVGQVGAALTRLLSHVSSALGARHASETRLRRFVADASHELRTPLAAIRGYSELALRTRDGVPPEIAHALARIQSEAGRMTTLVEDLLLLARLDSGRPLGREAVDLSRLVVDAASDAYAVSRDHRLVLDLPDEPVVVTGDVDRLHQVLANLLANTRTHTPAGTTVTVQLRAPDPNGRHVTLRVLDDGPGIPPEIRPHVFERFARGDGSRSRAAGSTGLGLAIVAAVVTAHDGTVDLTSRPGSTAFEVRLPAHPVASAQGFTARAQAPDSRGTEWSETVAP